MIIELKNISKIYENSTTDNNVIVLKDISLQVEAGNSIAIVGPSGSGKSTLLNILGILDFPTNGNVTFNGLEINKLKEPKLAEIRNRNIGFIFQSHHLLPQLTLLENVILPTLPYRKKNETKDLINRANDLLQIVGLADKNNRLPSQLSGGERQRVAVVRALINKPEVILSDEPTGSLDEKNASQIGDLLVQLNKLQNVAIVTVTHSLELANKMKTKFKLTNGLLEKL